MSETLPLFEGPHLRHIRFGRALERLDFAAALRDAPQAHRDALAELASIVADAGRIPAVDLERLKAIDRNGWPAGLERAWQRLVGRRLDGRGIPGTLDGEPAGAYLLRGGERDRAGRSLHRHLDRHPRDPRAWAVLAELEPIRAAARCGFHGGPLLVAAEGLLEMIEEDGLAPPEPWLLSYAWLAGENDFREISRALAAEGLLDHPPLRIRNDAHAFAWYLLDARGQRLGRHSVGVLAARQRMQEISPATFQRYLRKIG